MTARLDSAKLAGLSRAELLDHAGAYGLASCAPDMDFYLDELAQHLARLDGSTFDVAWSQVTAAIALAGANARVAALEAALAPFAALMDEAIEHSADGRILWGFNEAEITVGDVRRAVNLLGASS